MSKDPIEITSGDMAAAGASIREMQIEQQLAGLRLMPHMLGRVKDMARRGDATAAEAVRRYEAQAK